MESESKEKTPLRRFREDKGYTRPQVREKTGISERALAYIEEGQTKPNCENLASLARLYGKPLKVMFKAMGVDTSGIPDDLPTHHTDN